jgi:hypothetical protein
MERERERERERKRKRERERALRARFTNQLSVSAATAVTHRLDSCNLIKIIIFKCKIKHKY